jgi:signal transduction histidine kinase
VLLTNPGLRLRIALALALACLLVVGTLGVALYVASENLEVSLIDQIVSDEMDYLHRRNREDPGFAPQSSANLQGHIVRGTHDESRLPEYLRNLGPGRHELFVGNDEMHILMREDGGVRYYVAYKVGLHEQREQEFKVLVLLFVLTAALISLLLGYWLSGVLVSQLTDLAQQVSKLRPGQPRAALARRGQDSEVALLARAFDEHQARIENMIRHEREFTSNASHELRTPLTAIRTSCELLLTDPVISEKSRARVLQVSDAAGRMAEQLQALLLLARGQSLGDIEPVVLADCVAEAAEPYRDEIARKGLAFEIAIAPDAVLDLDYQALRLVLTNLIRNAVQYTERGFVKVGHASNCLTVADSGRGISTENLPRVFERFFRDEHADSGMGLGLSIVKRVCDHYGWSVKVESAPAMGSTFRIILC